MEQLQQVIEVGREQTDATLEAERERSDAAVNDAAMTARRVADDAIERDRQRADDAMRKLREEADRAIAKQRALRESIETERRIVDETRKREHDLVQTVVARERAHADATALEHERDSDEVARESIAGRREETDTHLAAERGKSDDALSLLGVREETLKLTQEELARRRDVIGIVAHDLRNPIAIISLNAQLLERAAPTAEMQEWADEVTRAAARMNRLVSDLLDVARIDSDAFALACEETDLARLVRETQASYEPLFAARGLALTLECDEAPCLVLADRERMSQVLSNLLGNAMKFTPKGGTVRLRLVRRKGRVDVEVTDSGPGIPKDRIPFVTKRFWQADGATRRGLGLGLYIVEKIVAAHRGELAIESAPGKGTTFRVSLPLTGG
jgi:signal transduction histidine kinase